MKFSSSKATARLPERRYSTAAKYATALRALRLIPNEAKARERLNKLVMTACVTDGRRGFVQAVEKVRFVAGETDGLESAILRALEEPDRVEQLDVKSEELIDAEAVTRSDFGVRG